MRTLTIKVERDERAARGELRKRFLRAVRTRRYQGEVRSFESPQALFRVLTPARWTLIERLQEAGASSPRELARRLGREVKAVHRDTAVLLEEGLVERDAAGRLRVPFDRILAEFQLAGAQAA
jgi:predicted transcriptional regulator